MWEWVKEKKSQTPRMSEPDGGRWDIFGLIVFFLEKIRTTIPGKTPNVTRAISKRIFCLPMTRFHPFRLT